MEGSEETAVFAALVSMFIDISSSHEVPKWELLVWGVFEQTL